MSEVHYHMGTLYKVLDSQNTQVPQLSKDSNNIKIQNYSSAHTHYSLYINNDYVGTYPIDKSNSIITIPDEYKDGGEYSIQVRTQRINNNCYLISPLSNTVTYDKTHFIFGVKEPSNNGVLERLEDSKRLDLRISVHKDPVSHSIDNYGIISSDFDKYYPYSRIKEVTDRYGNKFIRIPKFYVKVTQNGNGEILTYLSGCKIDNTYILHPCFYTDNFTKVIDYIDIGKYLMSTYQLPPLVDDNTATYNINLRGASRSQEAPTVNFPLYDSAAHEYVEKPLTLAKAREFCENYNDPEYNYMQLDIWTLNMLQILFKVEFATINSKYFMRGYSIAYNKQPQNNGNADGIPQNYTGSVRSNVNGRSVLSYRGIENFWGNLETLVDEVYFEYGKQGSSIYIGEFNDKVTYEISQFSDYNPATSQSMKKEPYCAVLDPLSTTQRLGFRYYKEGSNHFWNINGEELPATHSVTDYCKGTSYVTYPGKTIPSGYNSFFMGCDRNTYISVPELNIEVVWFVDDGGQLIACYNLRRLTCTGPSTPQTFQLKKNDEVIVETPAMVEYGDKILDGVVIDVPKGATKVVIGVHGADIVGKVKQNWFFWAKSGAQKIDLILPATSGNIKKMALTSWEGNYQVLSFPKEVSE